MFVRAIEGKKKRSVIYIAEDGRRMIRTGGSRQWRNNNPGAMRRGPTSRSFGAIGAVEGFAVFPDYKTGRDADRKLLLTRFANSILFNLPKRYSPESDGNDVKWYRARLKEFTGFDLSRRIRDLTSKDMDTLLDAIQQIEGYKPGNVEELPPPKPIIDVKRDKKGRPISYLVEGLGWLSPAEAVKGILSGAIDGVVAHRAGRTYVRTRPDGRWENNLEPKGREK